MSLVNYSSSSSSDEAEDKSVPPTKKPKMITTILQQEQKQMPRTKSLLPKALNKLGTQNTISEIDECDDPSKHGGRVRSFKHERGNWASYVYISVDASIVEDVQEAMSKSAIKDFVTLVPSTDLHISLSKTFVLQYHLIDSFSKSLQNVLDVFTSFTVYLRQLKIYTNEDRTRTFVALKVDEVYFEKMHSLMESVDKVMQEYKLSTFYEEPSFHTSILWCVGDHVKTLNSQIAKLEAIVQNVGERTSEDFKIVVNVINCRIGNKYFEFKLK